jgi:hypothetical protein
MNPHRVIPGFRMTSGLLVAFLALTLPAFPQAPSEGSKAAEVSAARNSLHELQDQINELSSALREMRSEVENARHEAAELKQDLRNTSDQLRVVKSELAATLHPTSSQAAPAPSTSEAGGASEARVDERLSKLEEEQQLLGAKIDDQYQTKVESGSKYRVQLSGMALFNAFTTRGGTDNFDLPEFAQARYTTQPNGAFGASLRQSILGLDVFGPEIAGASTRADLRADFFGGFPNAPNEVTSGIVRLRTAGLHLDWENTSLVVGQYAPFISPLSPTSLASVAYPALAYSGNLWAWIPQIYVEHRVALSGGSKITLQGGILDPLTGEPPPDSFYRAAQAGEQAGQPAYAARVAWATGSEANALSIGAGGYYARQNWGLGRTVDGWAGTTDWRVPLGHALFLSGEFYRGRAIGGLGAAEGRSVALAGSPEYSTTLVEPLNSTGGWAQLKFRPWQRLEFNSAFGEDFSVPPSLPYAAQETGSAYVSTPYTSIGRNQGVLFNSIYHLRSNLMFSAEYRRLRTSQTQPGIFTANQVSLSAATLF